QHTFGHIHCPACEQFRDSPMLTRSTPFTEAAWLWLDDHSPYIKPGTLRVYRQYALSLSRFLGPIPLEQIHIGNIRAYQRERSLKACPARINAEVIAVMVPVLKEV